MYVDCANQQGLTDINNDYNEQILHIVKEYLLICVREICVKFTYLTSIINI